MNLRTYAMIGSAAVSVAVLAGVASGRASAVSTSLPPISAGRVILDFQPHHIQARAVTAGSSSVKRFTPTTTSSPASWAF